MTYFVASQNVLEGRPFPHDVELGAPLAPNTPDEIRALADAGVEIGCHTRRHANLGLVHDPEVLYEEMVGCPSGTGNDGRSAGALFRVSLRPLS